MGEMFNDHGRMREIVLMKVPPHPGNEVGTVRIYRDELPEGAVVVGEEVQQVVEPVVETPAPRKNRR